MNRNDQQFMAQKIRTQYVEKQPSELDVLRELDAKVKRLANVFTYVFGGILASLAYPVYNIIIKTKRKKLAPEIIRLTDELMK